MRLLDRYIIFSSVFALFTEAFYFNYFIDIKLYYIILVSNFLLLSINHKISISKNLIIILCFILAHGVVSYLLLWNPINSLFAQLIGISISSVFFYNLLKLYSTKKIFQTYLNFAFWIAVLAIPMYIFKINSFSVNRLNGILTEPAHYAAIMLPATYVFFRTKSYLRLTIVIFTILLSKSSIGYFGLILILILPIFKISYFIKYAWVVIIILGSITYYLNSQWNMPVDENNSNLLVRRLKQTNESLNAINTGRFKEDTNLSSYAFISNAFISREIFMKTPLGAGLGGYQYEYDKFYYKLTPPSYLMTLNLSKINRTDANSLLLRMIGDFGFIALIVLAYFFYLSYRLFQQDKKILRQSTFFYLIVKIIREGHYFPPEFYFFLLIFLKEFDEDTTHS